MSEIKHVVFHLQPSFPKYYVSCLSNSWLCNVCTIGVTVWHDHGARSCGVIILTMYQTRTSHYSRTRCMSSQHQQCLLTSCSLLILKKKNAQWSTCISIVWNVGSLLISWLTFDQSAHFWSVGSLLISWLTFDQLAHFWSVG